MSFPIPHSNSKVKLLGSRCYAGNIPSPATAVIQNVDQDFMAKHHTSGDWVSVRIDGLAYLLNRDDLRAV